MEQQTSHPRYIDRVIINGVDNDISVKKLIEIYTEYPFMDVQFILSDDFLKRRHIAPAEIKRYLEPLREAGVLFGCLVRDEWANRILELGEFIRPDVFARNDISIFDFDWVQIDAVCANRIRPNSVASMFSALRARYAGAKMQHKMPKMFIRTRAVQHNIYSVVMRENPDVARFIDLTGPGYGGPFPMRPEFEEEFGIATDCAAIAIGQRLLDAADNMKHGPVSLEVMTAVCNSSNFLDAEAIQEYLKAVKPFIVQPGDMRAFEEAFYQREPATGSPAASKAQGATEQHALPPAPGTELAVHQASQESGGLYDSWMGGD